MSIVNYFIVYIDKFICQISKSGVAFSEEGVWVAFVKEFPEAVVKLDTIIDPTTTLTEISSSAGFFTGN